jgi:hypothetical protein
MFLNVYVFVQREGKRKENLVVVVVGIYLLIKKIDSFFIDENSIRKKR